MEEEAKSQKVEIEALIQEQRQNLQAKVNLAAQLDEDYAKLAQQGEHVKNIVKRFAETLIEKFQAKTQGIIGALDNETRKSLESVGTTKTEIQQEIKLMESSLEKADKLLMRSTNAELVQLKKSLETTFEEIARTETISRDPESLQGFVFVENRKMLDFVSGEEIGSLEFPHRAKASESMAEGKGLEEGTVGREAKLSLTTRNAEKRRCYDKRDNVTVEIRDEQWRECVTEVQIDDSKDGVYNISYCPIVEGRCKLTVKVNEEHVCGSPFTVQVVNQFHVKPALSFGKKGSVEGMFQCPRGVAVSNGDEIAVADYGNHRVQILNSNGNFIRSFGHQGSKQGEFNYPCGIAFDKNGHIFVAEHYNHRIQVFDGEGRYISMFGGKGSRDNQLCYPWGLSLDAYGNVIVADSGNRLIKFFSPDGSFLMKIGGPGSFSFPVHCVQGDEYLIVSDSGDHSMKVFSREGEYKHKFGKQGGGDGEFNHPCCLSVTESKHVLVCDSSNQRIQVFELNGKFVAQFEAKGCNLGKSFDPWSVAALSNNQIVVCDKNNHRILIFDWKISSSTEIFRGIGGISIFWLLEQLFFNTALKRIKSLERLR